MDETSSRSPARTRASTAWVGILVVIIATAVRIGLLVLGLLVILGALPDGSWDWSTIVPLHPLDETAGKIGLGILLALLVASAASMWGLWRRETWGWTLSIVTAGAILALDLGWWLAGEPRYASMVVNAVAVFYLNQRDLRSVFRV